MIVDVHAHLTYDDIYSQIDDVIERAKKAGVNAIVSNGTNLKDNKKVLELSRRYDIIKPALGLYPIEAEKLSDEKLNEVFDFFYKNKFIAFGEIGLDKKEGKDFPKQKQVFEKILSLAEKTDKPVIVHSRKAELDCIEIIESFKMKKVVMHCFSGKFKLVKRIEDNGWFFSIPTNIIKLLHFQNIVKEVSLNQLLTETDAPFLSPYKDRINEPSFIVETIRKMSEIKQMDENEIKNIIYMNFQKIFLKK
ncbi:TatD family hydrolase [Candidatus Woesearchaeota archaeon]|nr:TatD family hydrolase [Candidatus Woesearchaeota archaeon]